MEGFANLVTNVMKEWVCTGAVLIVLELIMFVQGVMRNCARLIVIDNFTCVVALGRKNYSILAAVL